MVGFLVTSNASDVADQLGECNTNINQAAIKTTDDMSQRIELSEKSLIRKKTGRAMQGITRIATGEMSRAVMPTVPYSYIIEYGRGQVLPLHPKEALYWPELDHPVARARAWPGSPFVRPSLDLGKQLLGPTAQQNVHNALYWL